MSGVWGGDVKRGWIKLGWRWGVSLIAVVVLTGTVYSRFYYYGVEYIFVSPYGSASYGDWKQRSVFMIDGQVWLVAIDSEHPAWTHHQGVTGFSYQYHSRHSHFKETISLYGRGLLGWRAVNSSVGPTRQVYCSGYILGGVLALFAAWSWWGAWRRRKLFREGSCVGCGYSLVGLDGGVCPECGAGTDVAS